MAIPVVIVPNGVPVVASPRGVPVTIVGSGGAGSPAIVDDGSSLNLTGPDGSHSFGTVTAEVVNGAVQRVTLPTDETVITGQAGGVTVRDADGTNVSCTATIQPQTGQLSYVAVPGTAALVTGGMSVKMANFGGAGPVDGLVQITGGFINWVSLAAQTDAIVSNGFSTALGTVDVSQVQDFATVNVSAGALQSVGVSLAATKTIVSTGQEITGVAPTGTYTDTVTFTVAGGVITGITLS